MKTRIDEYGLFRGQFSEEFITEYWDIEINGDFVRNWILIEAEAPSGFLRPKWNVDKWIEDATPQEIEIRNNELIDILSKQYREQILILVLPYLPDYVIDKMPIPSDILTQRLALIAECNLLIQEIDPTKSMSKPSQVKTQNDK